MHIHTSAKIIQVNEWGCRDAPWYVGTRESPYKDTSTLMCNPLPEHL